MNMYKQAAWQDQVAEKPCKGWWDVFIVIEKIWRRSAPMATCDGEGSVHVSSGVAWLQAALTVVLTVAAAAYQSKKRTSVAHLPMLSKFSCTL